MNRIVLLMTALAVSMTLRAESILFEGQPDVRLSIRGDTVLREDLSDTDAQDLSVVITQDGEDYFWRSRGNKLLVKMLSGAVTIYLAVDGSGYIRLLDDSVADSLDGYTYVEHLPLVTNSITYKGSRAE